VHVSRTRKFALRSVDAGHLLDIFLVCAIASVIGNRVFLIITGYPQLGDSTLHISHAIWGALMMAIAIVIALSFLPPFTRGFVAFLGGAGFGWFIDELGKFITRDVDYLYEPTIALIYIVFVAMYFAFRSIQGRSYGPDEAVLNALEAVKSASIGRLDETRRRSALALLDESGAAGAIAEKVETLLRDVPALPPHVPGPIERFGNAYRRWYTQATQRRGYAKLISTLLVILAIAKVLGVVALASDGRGIRGFSEWASLISEMVSAAFLVVGVLVLPRNRLDAYLWFDRGMLVTILITQIFVFGQEQLAGVLDLAFSIVIWVMVRGAIRAERERDALEGQAALSAGAASATAAPAS
jgi:hypothetical protein